jgi:ATP-dependent Clp protease ATP-binding subunit ClpX
MKDYYTLDGYKYCFTVPSGMLIARNNKCIFITGNSDVETIFQPLINKYTPEEISKSIIVIDEIDKKARKSGPNTSLTRDVSGEGVMYALLKLIEGNYVDVPLTGMRKHPHGDKITIDTSNILFILSGAFGGLSQIISDRLGKNEVGFRDEIKISKSIKEVELLKHVEQDDLIQFGLIPELVGRMPIISVLDELNVNDLVKILTEPKDNLISQYKTLLAQDNININFTEETINSIAQTAHNKKIGARGLKSVIEKIMVDFMFEVDRKNGGEYNIKI